MKASALTISLNFSESRIAFIIDLIAYLIVRSGFMYPLNALPGFPHCAVSPFIPAFINRDLCKLLFLQ